MPLLTYQQLADHYQISVKTMYQRVWRGEAPTPVLNPRGRVIGWTPESVHDYDRRHQSTRREYLYRKEQR